MPRAAEHALVWTPERSHYELVKRGSETRRPIQGAEPGWLSWLEAHGSFAFHGQSGRLSLLKEARGGAEGYWYAYRRHGRRVAKRYVGRSAQLSIAALEQIAAALDAREPEPARGVPQRSDAAQEPLLAPKLQPPRLHSGLITRGRLLAKLDAGLPRKLTLVSAPAGFGKSTLVRQWITERGGQRRFPAVAWVALDQDDNDPARFWRYVLTGCQRFGADVAGASLALQQVAPQLPFKQSPLEAAVTALLNGLAQAGPGILVLEDYHTISSPQIHETLAFLLDHLPAQLHVLIMSRHDPPLPLIRLGAAGELCRIDAGELRFSAEETRRFLQQALPLPLAPDLLELLERRVEGWAVGLRLLALALEGQTDREQIEAGLRSFAGTHHSIQEYFVSEVLSDQPPAVQRFLLETSQLGRLSASLCDAVTGSEASADLLSRMDRGNVLLEPLDADNVWYRYHALFAAAMQQEARRRLGDAALRELARRAGAWYQRHAMPAEAVEAALQAGDPAWAAALIGQIVGAHPLMNGPHVLEPGFHTLRRWLAQIPEEVLASQPRLLLVQATVLLFSFSIDMLPLTKAAAAQIDALLRTAERVFSAGADRASLGEVFAFRSMMLRQRGDFGPAAQWARRALEFLPTDDMGGRSLSLNAIGFLEMSSGRLDLAEQSIRAARALCETMGNPVYVRANTAMLSWIFFEQGRLYEAEAQLARVLAEARQQSDTDDIARSLHALAEIAYEWNDLTLAQRQIEESVRLSQHFGHVYEVHLAGMLTLARIESARGLAGAAGERFAALRASAETYQSPAQYTIYRDICMSAAWHCLRAGDLSAARRWIARLHPWPELPAPQHQREQRMEARLLLAGGQAAEALEILRQIASAAQPGGGERALLQTSALIALAHATLRQPEEARQALYDALALAYSEGYVRLFLDEGVALAGLLNGLLPGIRKKHLGGYARQLLRAFAAEPQAGATASAGPIDPLSPQEARVLHLLSLGRSNPEIARELVVSVNTVKAHLKNIYRKLGVVSRLEAAAAARARETR